MEKFFKQNGFIIYKEAKHGEVMTGSERMLALGGGVKARVMKTKSGKAIIESFYFDADRFDQPKAQKWIDDNQAKLETSLTKVQENLPAGSFQDITLRVQTALNCCDLFPDDMDGDIDTWVVYAFPDYVIVDSFGVLYKVPYTDEGGKIILGTQEKVSVEFVAQEANRIREKFENLFKPNADIVEIVSKVKFDVKEASSLSDTERKIPIVIIEAGKNFSKRRYYPKSTIQEASPLFAGLKMFINHPTDAEERARPERDLKDWVSTITESWYDPELGASRGIAHVHDVWLWEHLKDPVFRENIGISINASGKRYTKEIDGEQTEVIEKIFQPQSVDWVTEPGARGRVAYLKESQQKEGDAEMLKTVTLKELKEQRQDLINEVLAESKAATQSEKDQAVREAVAPLNARISELENKDKKAAQKAKVTSLVEASKLPAKAKQKLIESLSVSLYETEEKLADAVKVAVESELAYLKEVGGIKISDGGGAAGNIKEGITKDLEKNLGLKEEKAEGAK